MATSKTKVKKKSGLAKKAVHAPAKRKKAVQPKEKKTRKKMTKKQVKAKASVKPSNQAMTSFATHEEKTRKTLLEMREKLLSGIAEARVPEPLTTQSDIGDLVDQAGDERDRELSLLLSGRDKEKLMAINEALEKLREGTYGICEECGDKIGPARLKVLPLAQLCVACQAKFEKEISIARKAEEDLTYRGLSYGSAAEEEEG